jgi:hypothetical protein
MKEDQNKRYHTFGMHSFVFPTRNFAFVGFYALQQTIFESFGTLLEVVIVIEPIMHEHAIPFCDKVTFESAFF